MAAKKAVFSNQRFASVYQKMADREEEMRRKAQERLNNPTTTSYSWTGKNTNQMNTLEKTAYLRSFGNNDTARAAFSALSQEMQTTGSRHYSPYLTGKSNQKEAMEFFGINSFDQNWLNDNRFLLNYTTQLDHTDSVSTSGQKNWSQAQWAGYYYQMLSEAEHTTQEAENEWTQLRTAMQQNFNEYKRLYGEAPSYDKLMSYIDMNDYSTLQKMDKVYGNVEDLVRLNRSVDYAPETLVGVYASLLNGKDVTGDGDWFEEAVQYTMKPIHQPKKQAEQPNYSGWTLEQIEAKRQEIKTTGTRADLAKFESDLYHSNDHLDSVDSQSYFKDTYYDQDFLDKYSYLGDYAEQLRNKDGKIEKPAASDPWWYHAAYEYSQIKEREEETKKAEEEWAKLKSELKDYYNDGDDLEITLASIDWDDYPTLKKIIDGKDVDLNRSVYASKDAILGVLRAAADGEDVSNDDFDYSFYQSTEKAQEASEEPEKTLEEKATEEKQPEEPDAYFGGPSAYGGKIEGIDYEKKEDEPDIQEPPTNMNPEDFRKEEPYEFNPDAYFSGPAQTAEAIEADEQMKEERQSLMDDLWQDMTANSKIDATMVEKQFYEAHGRPMTQEERVAAGLAPRSMEGFDPSSVQLGVMDVQKDTIFDDTYNDIAQKYDYENMDQLIANDPALLGNMLEYIEAKPVNEEFSTKEVEHLKLLQKYQDDLSNGTLDEMFRAYADENGTDESRLNAALNYIIESGLTLEEKAAMGLLENDEGMQLIAQKADKLYSRGDEFTRAMAIGILGTDASEGAINILDAALSHLFALETGAVGGFVKSQSAGFSFTRDIYSALMSGWYQYRLGDDYTLDQACEIDPLLRGMTAAVDKNSAFTSAVSPDMSNFNYGAEFTQFLVDSAVSQKMSSFYSPVGQNFASSTLKKLGLGDLPEMLASDSALKRNFAKVINATSGSLPWMIRSMSDSAQQARDMGASEMQAIKYGAYSGATTGLIEGVIGQAYDSLMDKGGGMLSKGLSKLTKGGMDNLLSKKGVNYAVNLFQQAFSESMEELAEMPLDKAGQSMFLGKQLTFGSEDMKEAWEGMKMSFVSSLFTSAFFGLSAEPNTKLYTESEKLLDRIESGKATVDQMLEYAMLEAENQSTSADAEAVLDMAKSSVRPQLIPGMAEGGYVSPEVRDSVRIMEEAQAAMDEAAIDIVAEEDVQQQIAAGAMDDINGPASSNISSIKEREAKIEALRQQADTYARSNEYLTEQKRAALYNMVSNGISPDKGAARQTIHNIDESIAAALRKQEDTIQKMGEVETEAQLAVEHMQAQVEQRRKELKDAALAQRRQEFNEAAAKADRVIANEIARNKQQTQTGSVMWGAEDQFAPFSAQSKAEAVDNDGSIWDAYDEEERIDQKIPDSAEHLKDDNYIEIPEGDYNSYEQLLKMLADNDVRISGEHLRTRSEGSGENDLVREMTEGEYSTVARSNDGRYILVVKSGEWNRYSNQLSERDEMSDDERRQTKKPTSPKYTYRIIDTANVSAFETEGEQHFEMADVAGRIKNRISELKQQDAEDNQDRIRPLARLLHMASKGEDRRFISAVHQIIRKNDLNNIATEELKAALGDLYDTYAEQAEMSRYDNYTREQIEALRETDPEAYKRIAEYDKRSQQAAKANKNGARNRLAEISTGVFSNKNQAIAAFEKLTGEPEHSGVEEWKPQTYAASERNIIYYATQPLIDALADIDHYYTETEDGVVLDKQSFIDNHPGVFFTQTWQKSEWDQDAADARMNAPYESKLASGNGKYVAVDQADGFNLVIAKKDMRLDANQTGAVRVNPDIYSVSDAKQALQRSLDEASDLMKRQRDLHNQKELTANQKKYYQAMVLYSVRDENGQLVNRSFFDYVDPTTGQKRIPSADDLMNVAERITVNYTSYDLYYPQKVAHNDKIKGTTEMREQMVPYRDGGQDQYRFTLENVSMAPNATVSRGTETPAETWVFIDFQRAEADYAAVIGDATDAEKLLYFCDVCDAYYRRYMLEASKLSERVDGGNMVDAELTSLQQRMENCKSAMYTWGYIREQVANAISEQKPEALKSLLKRYDKLLKETGSASFESRMRLTSSMLSSMNSIRIHQLKSTIPHDATIQSMQAMERRLVESQQRIMNARNQAAVLNQHSPSAANNESLMKALERRGDTIRQQMELVAETPPETQEQTSTPQDDTVEAPTAKPAEDAPAQPESEPSQQPESATDSKTEEPDPAQKQQEMDRAYLGAIIDAGTGEFVNSADDVTGDEYIEADTGEFKQKAAPEVSAEDMSYATPVEEYMERAGLSREYPEGDITDNATYGQAEQYRDTAYRTSKALTERIDEIQAYLQSGSADEAQTEAIQAEKDRYIDERNRIKATAKRYDSRLAVSNYFSGYSVRNVAAHCLETGDVDWENPEVRSHDIDDIYENELPRIRKALQDKLVAGSTTALTIKDVAEIIGSDNLNKQLRFRYEVGFELSKQLHMLDDALASEQQEREEVIERIAAEGRTLELEAELGRIDESINSTKSMIENGQKSMRMYFDSGFKVKLSKSDDTEGAVPFEKMLSGVDGGRLPLSVMNYVYAILKDIDANTKDTNRHATKLMDHLDNPLRTMEHYTGEWAPLLNAIYINPVQKSNARMNAEHGEIVELLQNSGLKHRESADAMLYAEGKMTDEQFAEKYPNEADRDRIKRAIVEYREVYDALFDQVNTVLVRNGFDPIPRRKNYIHHMNDAESGIAKACAMLGIHIGDDELPTSMAGHTDETKPRRGYMAAAEERHGDDTVYDIERNTMAYVNAAMRVIHHTDNITRLRQFEGVMEQTHNKRAVNSGLAQYSEIVDTKDLKRPGRKSSTAFSSMREWVTEYTNLLAGKQSFIDRPAEGLIGRQGLQIANGAKDLVGKSIVVGNLNIAISNILPVMTMAGISPVQTAAALADVVCGGAEGMAAFEAQSDFLTARFAGQKFNYNWVDVATDKAMIPFEAIDRFAANAVVRTYQKIGLKKGWTPEVAMNWADQMAWRMMASNNAGEGANIMSSKVAGIFLQFSREGINNLQFLAHDLRSISGGAGDWLKKLLGIMIGGWLYNTAFNKTTAPEMITPTQQSIREWDAEKPLLDNLKNTVGNYAEMLNPTNIGTGGDLKNIPLISSLGDMGKAAYDMASGVLNGDGNAAKDGLLDFFSATLGFVPGGLSIERLYSGLGNYYRGYTTDSQGNIKFTIDNDVFSAGSIHDAIFTLLLSPSGTKGGREYTRGGNKAMTSTQTEAFHSEKATGMSNQEAFDSVMGYVDKTGNSNASSMVLPEWAQEQADTEWMQAVREFGTGAYPDKAPDKLSIDGEDRKLTDDEKRRYDEIYAQVYRQTMRKAVAEGKNLRSAAEKARSTATKMFKEEMEG